MQILVPANSMLKPARQIYTAQPWAVAQLSIMSPEMAIEFLN